MTLAAIYSADQRIITLTFKDPAGALEDITGHAIEFKLADFDDSVVVLKSVGDGVTISNQTTNTGEATVLIEPSDSVQWLVDTELQISVRKTGPSGPQTLGVANWKIHESQF